MGRRRRRLRRQGDLGELGTLQRSTVPILFVALALALGISDAQRGI